MASASSTQSSSRSQFADHSLGQSEHGATLLRVLVCATAVVPWLNPFTYGPSAAVVPWMVSFACGLLLWSLSLPEGVAPSLKVVGIAAAPVLWSIASHPSLSHETVPLAGGLILIVLATSASTSSRVSHGLQDGLLLSAVVSAMIGLCQYFGASSHLGPWIDQSPVGEAFGNLRQPNQFATLCWLGLAVLLNVPIRFGRMVGMAAAALLAVGAAASVSRTGALQGLTLTLMSALLPARDRRVRLQLCGAAAVAYVGATFLLPSLLEWTTGAMPARTLWGRISGGESCSSRTVLWSNVAALILQRPFIGWGWGELDYAHFMNLYPGARFCDILDNAHNLPLHFAVELGLPVALVACVGILEWIRRQKPWSERDPQRQLAWAVLAVIALHSLVEYPLWYGPFQIALGAALGWLVSDRRPVAARTALGLSWKACIVVLLVGATAYAGWDYWRISQIYLPPAERRPLWRDEPLQEARKSWLFASQVRFAQLTLTSVDRDNAHKMAVLAQDMLHYSPEPRVVERLIEADAMLGRKQEAMDILTRYRAAFPRDAEAWSASLRPGRAAGVAASQP